VEDGDDMRLRERRRPRVRDRARRRQGRATISKKWFRVRESYGIDVAVDADVAIDSLSSRD
jgi:hypothetical protein